jgi:hypothetical protein
MMKPILTSAAFAMGLSMALPAVAQSNVTQGTINFEQDVSIPGKNRCLIFGVANPVQNELGTQFFAKLGPNNDITNALMIVHGYHQYVGVSGIGAAVPADVCPVLPVVQASGFPLLQADGVIYFQ